MIKWNDLFNRLAFCVLKATWSIFKNMVHLGWQGFVNKRNEAGGWFMIFSLFAHFIKTFCLWWCYVRGKIYRVFSLVTLRYGMILYVDGRLCLLRSTCNAYSPKIQSLNIKGDWGWFYANSAASRSFRFLDRTELIFWWEKGSASRMILLHWLKAAVSCFSIHFEPIMKMIMRVLSLFSSWRNLVSMKGFWVYPWQNLSIWKGSGLREFLADYCSCLFPG